MSRRPPSSRLSIRFERWILGTGMTLVAFVVERRLLKALRTGGVSAAPRIAAARGPSDVDAPAAVAPSGEVSPNATDLRAAPP